MEQRAGWRHDEPVVADGLCGFAQEIQRTPEIVSPDVASIDDTERKQHCCWQFSEQAIQFDRCADRVEMECVHRQLAGGRKIIAQIAKVGRE